MNFLGQLQTQFVNYVTSLYQEGFVDDQFIQLQKLQDESNPDFVVEVVSLYFTEFEKLINNVAAALQQEVVDYKKIGDDVHQIKGSSSSIGARRVVSICVPFRSFCEKNNLDGCQQCLHQVRHEYGLVRDRLETLFGLERQILQAGGIVPMIA